MSTHDDNARTVIDAGPTIDANDVIDRLKEAIDVERDSELADYLSVSKSTISTWRRRNRIPYEEAVQVSRDGLHSLSWIITGVDEDDESSGGPVDQKLMTVIIWDLFMWDSYSQKLMEQTDKWKRSTSLSQYITSEYNRYESMMNEITKNTTLTRDEFIESLRKTVSDKRG